MQAAEKTLKKSQPDLAKIRQSVQTDINAVDKLILTELASQVPLINEITQHIIKSGGKRLRPLIVLLMAKTFNYQAGNEHHELAVVIEFVHTATLLHDDVVDESAKRRNQPTANDLWGNAASVLSGDFLYSRAFQILARRSNIPVMKVLADTTNQLSEGEVLQLMNAGNIDLTESDYVDVIRRKTAQLYSAAAEIGAIIATDNNTEKKQWAANYGLHLGMAFQMIDDLLDYSTDEKVIGKNIGDDLSEGKVTLPLIYTLLNGTENQKHVIQQAIKTRGREKIDDVINVIQESRGCEYTFNLAQKEAKIAQSCLTHLPDNIYHNALSDICNFVLLRSY